MSGEGRSPLGKPAREAIGAPLLLVVRNLPGPLGIRLRRSYWRRRLAGLGEGVRIDEGVHFVNPERIRIGAGSWIASNVVIGAGAASTEGRDLLARPNPDFEGEAGEVRLGRDVYLGPGSLVNGHGGVEIGDNVSLGPGAKLYSSSHHYRGPNDPRGRPAAAAGMRREPAGGIGRQALAVGPVVVASEAFVGSDAIVLPGVTIGPRTWLGAGVVMRRSPAPGRVYRAAEPVAADGPTGG